MCERDRGGRKNIFHCYPVFHNRTDTGPFWFPTNGQKDRKENLWLTFPSYTLWGRWADKNRCMVNTSRLNCERRAGVFSFWSKLNNAPLITSYFNDLNWITLKRWEWLIYHNLPQVDVWNKRGLVWDLSHVFWLFFSLHTCGNIFLLWKHALADRRVVITHLYLLIDKWHLQLYSSLVADISKMVTVQTKTPFHLLNLNFEASKQVNPN